MTIATRPDWNGNSASKTFEDIRMAIAYMKENPCYEILPVDTPIRPFGDIDCKVGDSMTEAEFYTLDFEVFKKVATFFKDHQITQFSASSYEYRKISHRWVIPDRYVESIAHAKAFASELYSRISLPEGVVGDMSVYSNARKMRTLWTSKPNENRPFYMLQGEEEDHIISYVPKWATLIDFDLQERAEETKPTCSDYEASYLTKLCDCVSVDTWETYKSAESLIFTMLSLNAPAELIHRYCSKASNYSFKWVNDYIKRYDPLRNKHSIGTLKFFAKRDNPTMYMALSRDTVYTEQLGRQMFEEMTRLTEDEHTKQNWCDEKGFLKELPNVRTLAVKSHLGTGKTTRCKEACTPSPFNPHAEKILIVSARQSFTSQIASELKQFVDYRNIKGEIHEDKVIVQVQSLHRCVASEPRDLLLLDEVESILANLTPNKTHRGKYMDNMSAFERLVRNAKRVIVLDAFLTDRTMEMLKTLRGDAVLVINPTIPYKRTATFVNESGLYEAIHTKLKEGKRLVAVWGARVKANTFHSALPASVSNVLYTSESDAKIKERDLADVNTHWADKQLVGYTASITVGINYNGPSFDEAVVYGTGWSMVARDYAQAIHRARKLKNNHLTVYLNPHPSPCALEAGLNEQEAQFQVQNERVKKFLTDLELPMMDFTTLPGWIHRVLMWNYNEIIISKKHFSECMKGYLALSGVSWEEQSILDTTPVKSSKQQHISVADVDTIDYDTAQTYARSRQVLTDTQRYELEKYYMIQKVVQVDQFIWDAWLDNRKQVERSWSVFNLEPTDLILEKVIDLVPKDAERLKVFQDLHLDWDTHWELAVSEVPKMDLTLFNQRIRSEKNTDEQYCRDLSKALKQWCGVESKVVSKREAVGDRGYVYSLKYSPQGQLFSYVARPLTAAQVFADE